MLHRIDPSHENRRSIVGQNKRTSFRVDDDDRHDEIYISQKSQPTQLAIYGGAPAFPEALHVGRPNIPDRERLLHRINNILDNEWLTNSGPYAKEFERRVAEFTEVKHCIATSNGTSALEITAAALNLTGEVIVPAMTFVATPHAFSWRGLTPVFADIDPNTCCIDPAHVERLITPKTSAIVGVHLWGRPCDTHSLNDIAKRHDLKLLFDSAHAFGCSNDGRMIGGFGEAEIFSFHATKFVAAGEGGAVVTNCDQLAERLRTIRNFGFTDVDQVGTLGTNAKMNEISAAFGITSLDDMHSVIECNQQTYDRYAQQLHGTPGIRLRTFSTGQRHNFQYIVVHIDESVTQVSRDEILEMLQAENCLARRYFYPGCHRSQPYGSLHQPSAHLPVTDEIASNVLCLPAGRSVSETAILAICNMIKLQISYAQRSGICV